MKDRTHYFHMCFGRSSNMYLLMIKHPRRAVHVVLAKTPHRAVPHAKPQPTLFDASPLIPWGQWACWGKSCTPCPMVNRSLVERSNWREGSRGRDEQGSELLLNMSAQSFCCPLMWGSRMSAWWQIANSTKRHKYRDKRSLVLNSLLIAPIAELLSVNCWTLMHLPWMR